MTANEIHWTPQGDRIHYADIPGGVALIQSEGNPAGTFYATTARNVGTDDGIPRTEKIAERAGFKSLAAAQRWVARQAAS
jgi:hypothetical protein